MNIMKPVHYTSVNFFQQIIIMHFYYYFVDVVFRNNYAMAATACIVSHHFTLVLYFLKRIMRTYILLHFFVNRLFLR